MSRGFITGDDGSVSRHACVPSHRVSVTLDLGRRGRCAHIEKPRINSGSRGTCENLGYGVYTGRLLYELWRLAARARTVLAAIASPTLLIQSRTDPRIAPGVAERALAAIGTRDKKLVWLEGAGHIITVDYGRAQVFDEVTGWIRQHTPTGR